MANSSRFRELRQRLAELRRHMLPAKFSPTGAYSGRQIDRTRGYRLLAHAEIESFIEEIAKEAAVTKISEWKKKRLASDLLICFLAFYHAGWTSEPENEPINDQNSRPKVRDSVSEAVDMAMRQYNAILESNHGIREPNIKKMILPLGVRKEDLDHTWLIEMDQFGRNRGDLAHNSFKALQPIDPKSELETINRLLTGLGQLDRSISKLLS